MSVEVNADNAAPPPIRLGAKRAGRSLWADNPILTKEMRTRMRGARAFWILFVYLFVLSLILFVTYFSWWQTQRDSFNAQNAAFTVGKTFYGVLFTVQALLVGLITPALTSGGVSIEKEQRTFELLSVSLLPRRSIVMGKLTAAVSFVVLLLVTSLPLVSIGFLLGGISPAEVATAFFLLTVTAFLYGAIGIACSAFAKSTTTATVMAYGTILAHFFVTLPLTLLAAPGFFGAPGALGGGRSVGLTALNPIGAVTAGTTQETFWGIHSPAWLTALILNGFLGLIFTVVAVHRLEYPRSDRSGLLRALTTIYVGMGAFCAYSLLAPGSTVIASDLTAAAMVTLLFPFVIVPIFAVGDGLPDGINVFRSLLDVRRLRRGEAPSGIAFCLLLVVLCGIILAAGLRWAGHAPTPNVTGIVTPSVPLTNVQDTLLPLFVLTASAVFFFGAWGVFWSALIGSQASAAALTATIMVLFYLLPVIPNASRDTGDTRGSAWDNLLYLSPAAGAAQIASPDAKKSLQKSTHNSPLIFGTMPFGTVTWILYGAGGIVLLLGAGRAENFRKRREGVARAKSEARRDSGADEDSGKGG